jgi:transposase
MQHYVGLDVSVKETSVCIIDEAGKVIREVKVATEPVAIFAVLTEEALAIERIGLEAGPLSQWLYSALAEAGLPVICVETRHMKAALSAQINKSDRNDARGIAQMMRVGQPEAPHAADQSPAFAGQGARHRERSAWHAAQFRPQGRHGGHGQV